MRTSPGSTRPDLPAGRHRGSPFDRDDRRDALTIATSALVVLVVAVSAMVGGRAGDARGGAVFGLALVGALPAGALVAWLLSHLRDRRVRHRAVARTDGFLDGLDPDRWVIQHRLDTAAGDPAYLLIGPGRTHLLVPTWLPRGGRVLDLRCVVARTVAAARDAERDLTARGTSVEVVPVVAVWGPGRSGIVASRRLGVPRRTAVVAGQNLATWSDAIDDRVPEHDDLAPVGLRDRRRPSPRRAPVRFALLPEEFDLPAVPGTRTASERV